MRNPKAANSKKENKVRNSNVTQKQTKIFCYTNRLSISIDKTSKMRNPKAANSKNKNKVRNSNVTENFVIRKSTFNF
jgi:hypothetical protein